MVVVGLLAVAGACTRHEKTVVVPVMRFVDGAPTGSDARRGTVGDQHRYVLPLRQNGFEATFESAELVVPEEGRLVFGLGASFEAPGGDRAVTFELRACAGAACEAVFTERVDFAAQAAPAWIDRTVVLERVAGFVRRFVFRAVTTTPTARAFWANPTLFAPVPREQSAHNVILLSLDTLRADHLKSYGYGRDTAPFLDEAFARGGTSFEHCVAAATTTTASHMTMFTAYPPSVHGVGLANLKPLPQWIATLPELLRAARFTTGAITENGWVTFAQGFGRGFETYQENKGPKIMEPKGQADVTFRNAEEWLRRHFNQRFFLFLHTYQVHYPYAPPPEYAPLFTDEAGASAPASVDAANYDREIRFTDDMLRHLFATMHELGIADDTLVVLTSDHGEEFSEHGCIWHGEQLYQEVTHVPLMVRGPGVRGGLRIPEPVGLVDVLPTILSLAGVELTEERMGVDLGPALVSGHAPGGRRITTESWVDKLCPGKTFQKPGFAVREGSRKLMRYRRDGAFVYELYDLTVDPGERDDRYGEGAVSAGDIREFLDGYEADAQARAKALRAAARDASHVDAAPLDARQREKLRALGYAE